MMKTLGKVLVGTGIVTATVGSIVAVTSKKAVSKVSGLSKRKSLKKFVAENMDKNPMFLKIVDKLNDQEVDRLNQLVQVIKKSGKQISLKASAAKEAKTELKKMFIRFSDNLPV